jgi:hypothetical protein
MKTLIFLSGRNLAESDLLVVIYDHLSEKSDQNTLDFQPKDAIFVVWIAASHSNRHM